MKRSGLAAVGAALFVASSIAGARAEETPVTTCGQVVSGRGILTADLDCSGTAGAAVVLQHRASLDLATFTLSGGDGDGVLCEQSCVVRSDDRELHGTIAGFAGDGVVARNALGIAGIAINRVTIRDNGGSGVRLDAEEGSVQVGLSLIAGNDGMGVYAPQFLYVGRSTISGNGLEGAKASRASVRSSVVEGNGVGLDVSEFLNIDHSDVLGNDTDGIRLGSAARVRIAHIQGNGESGIVFATVARHSKVQYAEVSDNGLDGIRIDGPQTERLVMKLVFARRNGRHGVFANYVLVNQCRIDDNAFDGIYSPPGGDPCRIGLDSFSLVGNGTDASCGASVACADFASCAPPLNITDATVCGTSYDTASGLPGMSWGICDDD